MVALAMAAMPSSRPVNPSRSLVVALTATRETLKTGDLGDARAHGVPVRSDFRALANQGDVEVGDASAARGDAIDGVFQEAVRSGAFPLRIARRKMRTDVAVRERAEDRVDQRVQADVTIGMRQKAAAVRQADATNHEVVAVAESMNVVAAAGSDIAEHGAETGFFADKIFRSCQFHVGRIAFKGCHRQSRPLGKRGVIGEVAAATGGRAAMGVENHIEPERLRGLRNS